MLWTEKHYGYQRNQHLYSPTKILAEFRQQFNISLVSFFVNDAVRRRLSTIRYAATARLVGTSTPNPAKDTANCTRGQLDEDSMIRTYHWCSIHGRNICSNRRRSLHLSSFCHLVRTSIYLSNIQLRIKSTDEWVCLILKCWINYRHYQRIEIKFERIAPLLTLNVREEYIIHNLAFLAASCL